MEHESNHYEVLGLDIEAPVNSIQAAVERLSQRADALAYTSPPRSRQLWARIRQIKKDLLLDVDRRAAYDRSLRATTETRAAHPAPVPIFQEPPPRTSRFHVALWGVAAAAAVAAIVVFAAQPASNGRVTHAQRVLGLSSTGQRQGVAYASGRVVRLQWKAVPGAARYFVHLAGVSGGQSSWNVTRYTRRPSYSLRVTGPRRYVWRVRALVHGLWGAYSQLRRFTVAGPALVPPGRLVALRAVTGVQRKELCWQSVPGAAAYRVAVSHVTVLLAKSSCTWVTVRPGTYRWRVATIGRDGLTIGRYSRWARFTVSPMRAHPVIAVAVAQPVVTPAANAERSTRLNGEAGVKGRTMHFHFSAHVDPTTHIAWGHVTLENAPDRHGMPTVSKIEGPVTCMTVVGPAATIGFQVTRTTVPAAIPLGAAEKLFVVSSSGAPAGAGALDEFRVSRPNQYPLQFCPYSPGGSLLKSGHIVVRLGTSS